MMQIEENGHQMGFLRKFMMENAGAACAKKLVEKFGDVKSKNVLVFAGLGNNGGDGLVIARHLAGCGAKGYGGGDHLIPRSDTKCDYRKVQGSRTIGNRHAVLCTGIVC